MTLSGTSVCTCGITAECYRDCAGARLQQIECAIAGHLTARSVYERAWGVEPERPVGEYCFRCGEDGS